MTNTTKETPTYEVVGYDLVLLADTIIDETIIVSGKIYGKNGRHSLTVHGDISASEISTYDVIAHNINTKNIFARNIFAKNIDAFNINAWDIYAGNINVSGSINAISIDAGDINAETIICEKRIKKTPNAKTNAISLSENRSELEKKEKIPQKPTYEIVGDNLILFEDTRFSKDVIIKGDITCKGNRRSLTVYGNITAKNIEVKNIYAYNIDAKYIDAENIHANNIYANCIDTFDIHANDINSDVIFCEKRTKRTPTSKTTVMSFCDGRLDLRREQLFPTTCDIE